MTSNLWKSLVLVTSRCYTRTCEWLAPYNWRVQESVKWKAGQYISPLIRHIGKERWRQRERDRDPFFLLPNELTEATSISSNVMLKWKLIVQYAATTLGHASSISISGGVTKWGCSLGPTPRKADTFTNQPDFSIWDFCAAGILDDYLFWAFFSDVCVSVYVHNQGRGPITRGIGLDGLGMLSDVDLELGTLSVFTHPLYWGFNNCHITCLLL